MYKTFGCHLCVQLWILSYRFAARVHSSSISISIFLYGILKWLLQVASTSWLNAGTLVVLAWGNWSDQQDLCRLCVLLEMCCWRWRMFIWSVQLLWFLMWVLTPNLDNVYGMLYELIKWKCFWCLCIFSKWLFFVISALWIHFFDSK